MKKPKAKDRRSFSEKHPKINMLVGFFILLILVAVAVLFVVGIAKGFSSLMGKLAKMDAVVAVAIITGGVSILGVIISSIIGKSIEFRKSRNEYLAKQREKPYGEFVEMVYKIQINSKKENSYTTQQMVEDISKFSKELTLWGSPKVAKKWKEFRVNGVNAKDPTDNLFILEEIMNEMRKDLGTKKIDKGGLLSFFINDIDDFVK